MTQNVEAWVSPQTEDEPLSARDRILEIARGRNAVLEHRVRVQALVAQVTAMRNAISEHVELLMSQGKTFEEARRIANKRVDDYEATAMAALNKQAPNNTKD
ncbi:hypothetical protein [Nocardiopsis metallicus]|uniref:Uncharacterized protein n=1 Tax=Nocardiopsis metallicus TaxID=179819 RepID=A0A840W253_9ACTN|nr:hypothetical protein [Nocardiopsis metallicus]MBB5490960.1 hypothetical protein [Nocardiopsis metallicus]